jgi:hypothetical protein
MDNLYKRFTELTKQVTAEKKQRAELELSDAYLAISKQIVALEELQKAMLKELPDSSAELEAAKADLIQFFRDQGITAHGDVYAKIKEKNEVNRSKLLNVIGGDMIYTSPCRM